ncbi:hypothetical protein KQX54_020253 [Cotesia glomerata]|uniref:Uncharacterized protein n=1 Tax=Cotesia glomerata TaxID=32391 RepID=A0AAV7J8W1_COTGL|nr:hypothetical protein KQX54_020253 [Cotesia glomerata]
MRLLHEPRGLSWKCLSWPFRITELIHIQDGTTSESLLEWYPSYEDDGKYLICRAENSRLSDAAIEDRWNLVVHCE